jgi:hypothetical protein
MAKYFVARSTLRAKAVKQGKHYSEFIKKNTELKTAFFQLSSEVKDRLCGLVVRVSGYRYRGLGFDSRRYQIF